MNADSSTPPPEKIPDTKPAESGGPPDPPPRPPKSTALDLLQPGEPEKTILLSDYIEIRELAEQLHLKPFKVVADVMELKQFKHADELIDFETASIVSRQHGYIARRIL